MNSRHLLLALLATTGAAFAAPFTAGNLVVARIGDGTTALSNAAAQVSIIELSKTGTVAQTVTLPVSGPSQVTDSGGSTSNGYINSYAGYLAIPGYNSTAATINVPTTNTKVATIYGSDGNSASRTLFPTSGSPLPFTGNNFRSVVATGANTFYATGNGNSSTGGAWYYDGSAFTQLSTSVNNLRNVDIYGGQLFVSSSSGAFIGISSVGTGLPTTSGQTTSLTISMGTGASPYGFVMFDTNNDSVLDTAFIADDRAATAGGGLQKWTFNGASWTNAYSLNLSASGNGLASGAGTGLRGLTGEYSPVTGFTLYGTTAESANNRLVQIIDNGSNPTTYTALASSGTNYIFRGVDLAPAAAAVPEPSAFTALAGLVALGLGASRRRRV